MRRGADKRGLFKARHAKRHRNFQPQGLCVRLPCGYLAVGLLFKKSDKKSTRRVFPDVCFFIFDITLAHAECRVLARGVSHVLVLAFILPYFSAVVKGRSPLDPYLAYSPSKYLSAA